MAPYTRGFAPSGLAADGDGREDAQGWRAQGYSFTLSAPTLGSPALATTAGFCSVTLQNLP